MPFRNRFITVIDKNLVGNAELANDLCDDSAIAVFKVQVDIDPPFDEAERFLERRDPIGRDVWPFCVAHPQSADLSQRELIYRAATVRHPVHRSIVHQHVMTIHGAAEVDFRVINSGIDCVLQGGERVFMSTGVVTAMCDHHEVVPRLGQFRGLGQERHEKQQTVTPGLHPKTLLCSALLCKKTILPVPSSL